MLSNAYFETFVVAKLRKAAEGSQNTAKKSQKYPFWDNFSHFSCLSDIRQDE